MINFAEYLTTSPGTYLLHIHLPEVTQICVGRLGKSTLRPGTFFYIGSALGPGGLQGRIGRHLSSGSNKCRHWHIDALTTAGDITEIWWVSKNRHLECTWSSALEGIGRRPIRGFGASDCSCSSHLVYMENTEAVAQAWEVLEGITQVKLKSQRLRDLSPTEIEGSSGEIT
jgi:Uri superfamily endonuclease